MLLSLQVVVSGPPDRETTSSLLLRADLTHRDHLPISYASLEAERKRQRSLGIFTLVIGKALPSSTPHLWLD